MKIVMFQSEPWERASFGDLDESHELITLDKRLTAARLGKFDLEALLADHILPRLRNVIITPHSAFNTREAVQRILDTTRANIEAFLGGAAQNIVT